MLPRLLLLSPPAFQVTRRAMASEIRFKVRRHCAHINVMRAVIAPPPRPPQQVPGCFPRTVLCGRFPCLPSRRQPFKLQPPPLPPPSAEAPVFFVFCFFLTVLCGKNTRSARSLARENPLPPSFPNCRRLRPLAVHQPSRHFTPFPSARVCTRGCQATARRLYVRTCENCVSCRTLLQKPSQLYYTCGPPAVGRHFTPFPSVRVCTRGCQATEGAAVSMRRAAASAQEAVRQKPANWGDINRNQRRHWKMRKGSS
jgi:hypothetical protein